MSQPSPTARAIAYRPEIDGLRALAVTAVFLFHAKAPYLQGGYLGVDAFFVISGFLIAAIVARELQERRFSFLGFYRRRVMRILPAYIAVVFVVIAASWALLPPFLFSSALDNALASALFVSNFAYWSKVDYFNAWNAYDPLIHTWSLSVEEQFYLVFPALIFAAHRLLAGRLSAVMAVVGCVSAIGFLVVARQDASAAFYFTPLRFWEFLLGAAFTLSTAPASLAVRQALALLGFGLLGGGVLSAQAELSGQTAQSLAVCLGVALLLWCGRRDTLVGRALAASPLVAVGLISYSLYLWHQPVLVFARLQGGAEGDARFVLGSIAGAGLLAYLTWRFVEDPLRRIGRGERRFADEAGGGARRPGRWAQGVLAALAALVVVALASREIRPAQAALFAAFSSGEEQSVVELIEAHQGYSLYDRMLDNGRCVFWSPTLDQSFVDRFDACRARLGAPADLLIGDSHAMNLYNALAGVAQEDHFFVAVAAGGCRPQHWGKPCYYEAAAGFARARRGDLRRIFFHQSGSYFTLDQFERPDSDRAFDAPGGYTIDDAGVERTLKYLARLKRRAKIDVLWIGPFYEARRPFGGKTTLGELLFNPHASAAIERVDARLASMAAADPAGASYVSILPMLAPLTPKLVHGDCLIALDRDHFSSCGERMVGRLLQDLRSTRGDSAAPTSQTPADKAGR